MCWSPQPSATPTTSVAWRGGSEKRTATPKAPNESRSNRCQDGAGSIGSARDRTARAAFSRAPIAAESMKSSGPRPSRSPAACSHSDFILVRVARPSPPASAARPSSPTAASRSANDRSKASTNEHEARPIITPRELVRGRSIDARSISIIRESLLRMLAPRRRWRGRFARQRAAHRACARRSHTPSRDAAERCRLRRVHQADAAVRGGSSEDACRSRQAKAGPAASGD